MAGLSDAATASDLEALFKEAGETVMSDENYAKRMSKIINDSIRRGLVNPGIPTQTGGSTTDFGTIS